MRASALLCALALAGAACGSDEGAGSTPATTANEPATAEAPGTGEESDDSLPPIVVEEPRAGAEIVSPVTVSGTANVFEANVTVRLLGQGGRELAHTFTTATCGSGCRGTFSVEVPFEVARAQDGTVVVHDDDAAGTGSPPHVVRVAVRLSPAG